MPDPPAPLLLTYKEVTAMLQVSGPMLRQLIRDGHITAIKIGRAVRIPTSEVRAYVEAEIEAARDA